MDVLKLNRLFSSYDACIVKLFPNVGIERRQHGSTLRHQIEHLRWMLHECSNMVARDKLDKATRWLGYVEGSLVQLRVITLEEVQYHDVITYMPET